MRVSVVVPLFNKERYVARCLQSILSQDFQDFEVIVVNDGSTDASDEVARTFTDVRLRLISQTNAGPGAARNRGMAEATAEYVAFLDADDEWLPEFLSSAVRALDGNLDAACGTWGHSESPSYADLTEFWRNRGLREGPYRVGPHTDPALFLYMVAYMHPCSTLSRTAMLRQLGGFYDHDRCRYAEDAFLFAQVILNYPVLFSFKSLVRIDRNAAQLSNNLKGSRPVEPFLQRPERLEASCPPELKEVLGRFLTVRAFKTACVLGYWGDWEQARRIRKRFSRSGEWRLPYFWPSLVCATPAGPLLGAAWRRIRASSGS